MTNEVSIELREINRWQKIQTLILGAIAAALGVNLAGVA
jgi:hypothetical protein